MVLDTEDDSTKGVVYSAPKGRDGVARLKVRNFIGVLATESGSLEILPKIASDNCDTFHQKKMLRAVVARMLETVPTLPFRQTAPTGQDQHNNHLFEWFMAAFLNRVKRLVARGLRSAYELKEDNLPVLRGRLLMSKHLRFNAADASRLYVQFDEFTTNRIENRVIHAALQKVWRTSRTQENRRLARELMFAFADLEVSRNTRLDLSVWKNERGASHYVGLDSWCRAILNEYSSAPSAGHLVFDSFLFPAEKLFEAYVAQKLKSIFSIDASIEVYKQVHGCSLFSHKMGPFGKRYDIRPDIVITKKHSKGNEVLICDTKWKIYDDGNAQVSQADLYQLFAYANYFSNGSKKVSLALIAPKAARLSEPTRHIYHPPSSNQQFELWMVPYDLWNIDNPIPPPNASHECEASDILRHLFNNI
jgi:5-methylcytosine-specific restriction enzyme subunit McrC